MFASAILEFEKLPLFERLPSPGKRLLGCDRHSLRELHRCDLVRIIKVTLPGHKRPINLVHVPSLVAYVERVEQLAEAKQLAEIRKRLRPSPRRAQRKAINRSRGSSRVD
jgi:hypothetical protein